MNIKTAAFVAVSTIIIVGAIMATGYSDEKECRQPNDMKVIEMCGQLTQINDSFFIDGTELLIGSKDIISKQAATFDYDSDTVIETIKMEITGLQGTDIHVSGHLQDDNALKVTTLNQLPLTPSQPQPPPRDHQPEEKDHPAPVNGEQ